MGYSEVSVLPVFFPPGERQKLMPIIYQFSSFSEAKQANGSLNISRCQTENAWSHIISFSTTDYVPQLQALTSPKIWGNSCSFLYFFFGAILPSKATVTMGTMLWTYDSVKDLLSQLYEISGDTGNAFRSKQEKNKPWGWCLVFLVLPKVSTLFSSWPRASSRILAKRWYVSHILVSLISYWFPYTPMLLKMTRRKISRWRLKCEVNRI